MIKIFPSSLHGSFTPAGDEESFYRCLVASCFSKKPCKITVKGISDNMGCAIFALERLGADIKISDGYIETTPVCAESLDFLTVNFRNAYNSLPYLLPAVKSMVDVLEADCSELLASKDLSDIFSSLEDIGCSVSGKYLPTVISGNLKKEINLENKSSSFCDSSLLALSRRGIKLMGGNFSQDALRIQKSLASSDSISAMHDEVYFSMFLASCKKLTADSAVPQKIKRFINIRDDECSPKLLGFRADFSALGDFFFALLILAMRTNGTSVFFKYEAESEFHNRLYQLLSDLKIKFSISRGELIIHSDGVVRGTKARAWNNPLFAMTAAFAGCFSEKGIKTDAEDVILTRFPCFFDDLKKLGAKIVQL